MYTEENRNTSVYLFFIWIVVTIIFKHSVTFLQVVWITHSYKSCSAVKQGESFTLSYGQGNKLPRTATEPGHEIEFLMTFHLWYSPTTASKVQWMPESWGLSLYRRATFKEHECNQKCSWGRHLLKFQFYSCHISPPSSSEKSVDAREVKENKKVPGRITTYRRSNLIFLDRYAQHTCGS